MYCKRCIERKSQYPGRPQFNVPGHGMVCGDCWAYLVALAQKKAKAAWQVGDPQMVYRLGRLTNATSAAWWRKYVPVLVERGDLTRNEGKLILDSV